MNASTHPTTKPSRTARTVAISTAILGGIVLSFWGATNAFAIVNHGLPENSKKAIESVATDGISGVDIDANAAMFTLAFGDVKEAELEVDGAGKSDWRMSREGDQLRVENLWRSFGGFGICLVGCTVDIQTVTLTLPRELEKQGLDLDASLDAGEFNAEGNFHDTAVAVNAGLVTLTGAAQTLDLRMNAGSFRGELSDVGEARLNVMAGKARAELSGKTPSDVDVQTSAGSVDLLLPDDSYRVEKSAIAGSIRNELRIDSRSKNVVTADATAGNITLRPGN